MSSLLLQRDRLLTVDEVADLLGFTSKALRCRMARGEDLPPHFKVSCRSIRFSANAVQAWIEVRAGTASADAN